jgi:hypothetical protein
VSNDTIGIIESLPALSNPIERLLVAAFGEVPRFVREIVAGHELCDLESFAASVVFPFADRPVRIAASDRGIESRWERLVRARHAHPDLSAFLALGAPGVRRMLDTDGSDNAEIYLDDLPAEHGIPDAPSGVLMSATMYVPSGKRSFLVRHESPPLADVPDAARPTLEALVDRGAQGRWATRIGDGACVGFLWISESRWRGDAKSTCAIADSLSPSAAWDSTKRVVLDLGWQPYPDAIEWTPRGLDVTLGITR